MQVLLRLPTSWALTARVGHMAHDVVVLGATVAGLTAARRLAAEGFDVLVLDPNPVGASAAIGHGVAACAHASTVANMRAAYGDRAVAEHVRRNLAGVEEVRRVAAAGGVPIEDRELHDHSLGFALERELAELSELLNGSGAQVRVLPPSRRRRASAGLLSQAACLDPAVYAAALTSQSLTAGVEIRHDVTVVKLVRRDGLSHVAYRDNLAWVRDPRVATSRAVVDTMGVSPWGRTAAVGGPQVVPVLRGRPIEAQDVVTLLAGPPVWMMRPWGEDVLLLGTKTDPAHVDLAAAELQRWADAQLLLQDTSSSVLTIDPSDHGRPLAGASGIPGSYYVRGNGRGELMNGTASGTWLAAVLLGDDPASKDVALPFTTRARAHLRGMLRKRDHDVTRPRDR